MQSTTYTPKRIVAFDEEPQSIPVTIATGLTLAAGTLIGVVTSTGLGKAWDSTSVLGDQTLAGVLADKVDTTDAGETLIASMYICDGILFLDQLVGLTGFEADVQREWPNSRQVSAANLFII